ncbi:hypothetical protein TWF718_006981 [Orbilia javanica]|uniref:RanBD1 domain-containing protein n=1 Tax=Orbilia javanica TaxID=47235 RepID=A0AAN8RDI2_9PEZI
MAKRGATEQITKDTWERDEDDGGRDRSEEPAELATQAVLAKRKILKPKSRVGGVSAVAPSPSPASSGLFNFGQQASSSATNTPLFGQLTQTTPSKNLFNQPAPLSSTPAGNPFSASTQSPKPLFSNLFGTPSETTPAASETASVKSVLAGPAPQIVSNLFGAPALQQPATNHATTNDTTTAPKPSTFTFSAPHSQVAKPGPSIFASSQGQNNNISEPQKSLFGLPTHKLQEPAEVVPSSTTTTPIVTPVKPSLFSRFGDSDVPSSLESEPKPLFGTPPNPQTLHLKPKEKGESEKETVKNEGGRSFGPNGARASSNSLFSVSKAAPATTTNKRPRHDPKSLIPPPGAGVTKQDMPTFNWLYQVKSLNLEIQDRIREALSRDPFTNLTSFIDYYQDKLSHIDFLKLSQEDQLGEKTDTEANQDIEEIRETTNKHDLVTPSKASKLFESVLAPPAGKLLDAALQHDTNSTGDAHPFSGSLFQPKPSTGLFNQPPPAINAPNPSVEPVFSGTTTKPLGLFGAAPSSSNDTKTTSLFQFGSQTKAPANIFDPAPPKELDDVALKPFAPHSLWNSKPNSAVASNASSPGSVLAGGTAGMKDSDTGGWSNPFTPENPLFLPGGEDDEDEDGDGDGDGDNGEEVEGEENARGNHESEGSAPEPLVTIKAEPTSIFGAQSSSSSSLFGRVTSAPTFNFGQAAPPKTGAIGLFGSTTATSDKQTWTPDKGIKFGDRPDSKGNIAPNHAPVPSLFGSQSQSPTPGSLFGTVASNIPTFNFAQPTNGKSIFSNPPPKPAVPSLFGGPPGGGLAPPVTAFGGPSPAPSDTSTPGETSNKEGGDDDNDPSDEAGQQGGNTKDLSGKGPGEEDEDEVFETRSSIYNLNNGAYVKIGIGRLRVLKNRVNDRARIVVKVETGKVLMNVGLRKELDYTKVSESEAKGKVVKIIEFLPEGKSRVWVMKVGTVELAQKLRKTLEEKK